MRYPDCASQRTVVKTLRNTARHPEVTLALIVINVVAFLAEEGIVTAPASIAAFSSIVQRRLRAVPEYLDPLDAIGWLEAVEDYSVEISPRRAAQLARLPGWTAPSWNDHFQDVLAFLANLSSSKPPGNTVKQTS